MTGEVEYAPPRRVPKDWLPALVSSKRPIIVETRGAGIVRVPGRAPIPFGRAPHRSPALTYTVDPDGPVRVLILEADTDPGIVPASCMWPPISEAVGWESVIAHELGHALAYAQGERDVDALALAYENVVREKVAPRGPKRLFHLCAAT